MKAHVTTDIELRDSIREGLRRNDGYCPCIINGNGVEKYKCPCDDFLLSVKVGDACRCGLYIKDEDD